MATIDKLDPSIHTTYALLTKNKEEMGRQYPIAVEASVASQTQIIDFQPKLSALESLLGSTASQQESPFAHFVPPKGYYVQTSHMFSYEIIPDMKNFIVEPQEPIACDAASCEIEKSDSLCDTYQPFYSYILKNTARALQKLNQNLNFVRCRMAQFLQG